MSDEPKTGSVEGDAVAAPAAPPTEESSSQDSDASKVENKEAASSPAEATGESEPKLFQVKVHHEEDEVKEKLFSAPDFSSVEKEVSSLWGWVSSKSSSLTEKAQDLAKNAAPLKEKLTPFTEKLTKNVHELSAAAESKSKAFIDQMQHEAAKMASNSFDKNSAVLPWEEPSSKQFADAIRDRILVLSGDEKTFLVPPPDAVDFHFDFVKEEALALKVMEADPNLEQVRFKLVPKQVDETTFWRNYFYRVMLIKEAYQVSSDDSQQTQEEQGDQTNQDVEESQNNAQAGSDSYPKDSARVGGEEGELDMAQEIGDDEGLADPDPSGWQDEDDGLDLNDNFDMLDDDELLASAGLNLGDAADDDDDDDDADLEARIKAQLDLDDDDDDDDEVIASK